MQACCASPAVKSCSSLNYVFFLDYCLVYANVEKNVIMRLYRSNTKFFLVLFVAPLRFFKSDMNVLWLDARTDANHQSYMLTNTFQALQSGTYKREELQTQRKTHVRVC